ncbi:MAG TPA: phage tail sheath C-terminal domain-containing protein [Roseiflexaceae bacterium]|nr:phage tail sheath C-terminal domain-containing protein [Roseiflexaceae bacterium]
MFGYTTPGVYFEWQDTASHDMQPARVDIAGFVGIAERGPLHRPVRVESWNQFVSRFGRHTTQGFLAYAVQGFFANGGRTCWVVRVADPSRATYASLDIVAAMFGNQKLRLTATSPGTWAHRLHVTALQLGQRFSLILRLPDGTQEVWRNLTLDPADERFVETLLNPPEKPDFAPSDPESERPSGSLLVRAKVLGQSEPGTQATLTLGAASTTERLAGGADGLRSISAEHISGYGAPPNEIWGLATLENVSEISIVAIPDIMPTPFRRAARPPIRPPSCADLDPQPDIQPYVEPDLDRPWMFTQPPILELQRELVSHCERFKNRVAILDTRLEDVSPQAVVAWRHEFDSTYAALYWPWLRVPDPFGAAGALLAVPPSGHVAGIYARVETAVGAHKPPANELVETARDVTAPVDDLLHGYLNDNRVNVIRAVPGRGLRVAGARTLSSDTDWMYINVRRLLIMIERAIDAQTQWLVFEPNNPGLWRDVERVVRSFLNRIWQQGMLEGATAEQAFQVTCDETSNPTAETEAGRLITLVGVQPPWPAEFVVVRIGKTESGIEIL